MKTAHKLTPGIMFIYENLFLLIYADALFRNDWLRSGG